AQRVRPSAPSRSRARPDALIRNSVAEQRALMLPAVPHVSRFSSTARPASASASTSLDSSPAAFARIAYPGDHVVTATIPRRRANPGAGPPEERVSLSHSRSGWKGAGQTTGGQYPALRSSRGARPVGGTRHATLKVDGVWRLSEEGRGGEHALLLRLHVVSDDDPPKGRGAARA